MPRKLVSNDDFEETQVEVKQDSVPSWGSVEWSEYALSHLTDDEKVEGLPTCNGLRRLFFSLFDVVRSERDLLSEFKDEVVVGWKVVFVPRKVLSLNESIPTVTISATASCSTDNTKHPFSKYLVAVADTRAEARAYRKALLLNCLAAEEVPEGMEDVPKGDMGDAQKKMILNMCKMNKIHIADLLRVHKKEIADKGHDVLVFEHLTKSEAGKVLNVLNAYQSNSGAVIPEEIKVKE